MIPEYYLRHRSPARLAKWSGGKGGYAKRIVEYIPEGKRYMEPYCGMANVFLHLKNEYPIYALNDLNYDVINTMRVLQDKDSYNRLLHRLVFTPYSMSEFRTALAVLRDDNASAEDRAWAFFTAQNQGFSGVARSDGNWGRTINPSVQVEPSVWQKKISNLEYWHKKLIGVYLDNKDAIEFIKYWDEDEDSVFYLDPPYIEDTRVSAGLYKHETTNQHHVDLVNALLQLKGKAVLSCYDHEIYEPLTNNGWNKVQFSAHAHMATKGRNSSVRLNGVPKRIETLYIKEK